MPKNRVQGNRLHRVGIPKSCVAVQAGGQDHQPIRAEVSAHYRVTVFEVGQ